MVLSFCLISCECKAQIPWTSPNCPPGYGPTKGIEISFPQIPGQSPSDPCWTAYQNLIDLSAQAFADCQLQHSDPENPRCVLLTAQYTCEMEARARAMNAYKVYLRCSFLSNPPMNPPPGAYTCTLIPGYENYHCYPTNLCADLVPEPPADGHSPTEFCYIQYLDALDNLCTEYQEDVYTQCDTTGIYCWDCECLADKKAHYQFEAMILWLNYYQCLPVNEGPPSNE